MQLARQLADPDQAAGLGDRLQRRLSMSCCGLQPGSSSLQYWVPPAETRLLDIECGLDGETQFELSPADGGCWGSR